MHMHIFAFAMYMYRNVIHVQHCVNVLPIYTDIYTSIKISSVYLSVHYRSVVVRGWD